MDQNSNFHNRLCSLLANSITEHSSPTNFEIEDLIFFADHTPTATTNGTTSPLPALTPSESLQKFISDQRLANEQLRQGFLQTIRENLAIKGTLSDVARSFRLGRVLDVHLETITVEEEIKRRLPKTDNIQNSNLKKAFDTIGRETEILLDESNTHIPLTDTMEERKQWELKIYHIHDAIEKILRALHVIVLAVNGSSDTVLQQFDNLCKYDDEMPTLLSTDSVNNLLQSLPQRYNLEILLMHS